MTNEKPTTNPSNPDETIILLKREDGTSYNCEILDIFEFEGQKYALLLKVEGQAPSESSEKDDGEGSLVIMRLTQRDDQSIFGTIESDEEYEKVVAYVEELSRRADQ